MRPPATAKIIFLDCFENQGVDWKTSGSRLVSKLNEKRSVQIAIRLPGADLARAREVVERKGISYQTLLKMLVHEGLARGAHRQ